MGSLSIPQMIWVNKKQQLNDNDKKNLKNSEKNRSQYQSVNHKSYKDWPGHEPRHPWWEAGD
jgi:hypothetical protein